MRASRMIGMRVHFELDDDQIEALVRQAVLFGFRRFDPRKKWSKSERLEAARFAAGKIVFLHIDSIC